MSALTTMAIIGWTAAAASQVAAAKIGSNAAKDAAKTQADASNQALGLQQQVYQDQQQAQSPYMQLGQQAAGKLSGYTTPSTPFNPNDYSKGAQITPAAASPWGPSQIQPTAPQQASLSQMGSPMQNKTMTAQQSAQQGLNPAVGQTVKMRAPNGEMSDVPMNQKAHYLQLGATEVF